MNCKICGNPLNDDAVFCPHCGKKLVKEAPREATKVSVKPARQQSPNAGYGAQQEYNGYAGTQQSYGGDYGAQQNYNGGYNTQQSYNGDYGTQQNYNDSYRTQQSYNGNYGTQQNYNNGYNTQQTYNGDYNTQQNYNGGYGAQPDPNVPEFGNKVKTAAPAKIVAAVLAVIVVVAGAFGLNNVIQNKHCSEPFDALESGFEDRDITAMLEAFPDEITELLTDNIDSEYISDAEDELDEAIEEGADEIGFGSDFEISHEIVNREKLTSDQLDRLNDIFDDADLDIEVKTGYNVDVRFIVTGDNGNESYVTANFSVGKIDGEWKIVDFNEIISDYSQYSPLDTAFSYITLGISKLKNGDFDDYDDIYDLFDF
jgi:hypothetical protein